MRKYKTQRNYTRSGALLKSLRQRADKTQREVSHVLQYSSAQFISNFENGIAVPPTSKLAALRRTLKLSGAQWLQLLNTIADEERALFYKKANSGVALKQ